MTMANRTGRASGTAFAPIAPVDRSIRTCPTSTDGATSVADDVTERMSVDVVWSDRETGNVCMPTRGRSGDGGGHFFTHHEIATRASWASATDRPGLTTPPPSGARVRLVWEVPDIRR